MSDESNTGSIAETSEQFTTAINGHDVDALTALMTADHLFVDSLGNRGHGVKSMQVGWRAYFTMCRVYWVRIDKSISERATVLAAGEAGGTIDGVQWRIPV